MSSYGITVNEVQCECLNVKIPWCERYLAFPFNLAGIDVVIVFRDKFQKEYEQLVTTDINGIGIIDINTFPSQLLNPYAGTFYVYAYHALLTESDRVYFNSGTYFHPCLKLTVVDKKRSNFSLSPPYNVEMNSYLCCCASVPKCPNIDLPKCPVI